MPSTTQTLLLLFPLISLIPSASSQYTATYTVGSLPASSEEGQSGTNQCGTTSSQDSGCQNLFVNSVDDFCLWGPPATTSSEGDGTSKIGNVEQIVVSYCLNDGYGTRRIPDGAITGAHFVKVENDQVSYVQVSGVGDFTGINIPAGDDGGELDPHSWTGLGNPQGGLVFTNAFSGAYEQTHEWTSFMSATTFCVRACRDGPNAAGWCEHIYDTLSCGFTIPGSFDQGYDDCLGDPSLQPGVYNGTTFHQGDPTTPAPHPAGPTSMCTTRSSIGGGFANVATASATAAPSSSASYGNGSISITSTAGMNASTSTSFTGNASSTITSSASSLISSTSAPSRLSSALGGTSASGTGGVEQVVASASASPTGTSGADRTVLGVGVLGVVLGVLGMLVL